MQNKYVANETDYSIGHKQLKEMISTQNSQAL